MSTRAARASVAAADLFAGVASRPALYRAGCTPDRIRANLAAHRWQRLGKAVVLHNGTLTRDERWRAGVINCGPRAELASFSAAEANGLTGWRRDEIHVLAPAGVARPRVPGLPIVLHRTAKPCARTPRRVQRLGPALMLAAGSFTSPRPAVGILAAGVQQRLIDASDLRAALADTPRLRHHKVLASAVDDIEMGSHALSEIDFVRLCRRFGLPVPLRQAVRRQRDGRRRYLDAEWRLRDGRRLVVEVDGALHLVARRWYDDQLRQNELVLTGATVLRYPSFVVRAEQELVAAQLRIAFGL